MLIVNNQEQALLGFNYFSKIGPVKMKKIENYFSDLAKAFWATSFNLERAGLEPNLVRDFIAWRPTFHLEATLTELKQEEINFITWHDASYPRLLLEISSPPYILYYKGLFPKEKVITQRIVNRLAIVGSRKHSAYADKIITELLPTLISAKIEIISGLAKGIDALAHQATLNHRGKTIAILGSGLSAKNIYPRSNQILAKEIIKSGGALISEFPPQTPPLKQNFPQRNRIISGLSPATLIIEAPGKSGALITAQHALEQNREVLAIPGNIFSEFSEGPNNLIKAGAKVVTKLEDILEIFKIEKVKMIKTTKQQKINKFTPQNESEKIIYEIIKQATERGEKLTAEEIIQTAQTVNQLDTAIINSTLSILEIKGFAKNDENGYALS